MKCLKRRLESIRPFKGMAPSNNGNSLPAPHAGDTSSSLVGVSWYATTMNVASPGLGMRR